MPLRRKRERFEQLTKFERGRIIGLCEAELSYRAVAARVQHNSSTEEEDPGSMIGPENFFTCWHLKFSSPYTFSD